MAKAKALKIIVSVVVFFSFVYWGLDSEFICKFASDSSNTCDYSERIPLLNFISSVWGFILTVALADLLIQWARKD
ncbi:hypothetical protein KGN64_003326 [Salmonella enterica]|nr:hypothetical protein [Salmonella enterica]EHM5264139.1 hypothetical protein [Salmonella enterica]